MRLPDLVLGASLLALAGSVCATTTPSPQARCEDRLVAAIPARAAGAASGSEFATRIAALGSEERDAAVRVELLRGNLPPFLRRLVPVTLRERDPAGRAVEVTACVLPDYLALGSDRDFLLVSMGLQAALEVADRYGFVLPTPKLVDAIYAQSAVKLEPLPLPASSEMRGTPYLVAHNGLIAWQRASLDAPLGLLIAGHKKDLVVSNRLWQAPGRVAIYGWHRGDGQPIQPLSTVHGARYADYSHGVRLVSNTVYVNGAPRSLAALLADPELAAVLSDEGPLHHAGLPRLAAANP